MKTDGLGVDGALKILKKEYEWDIRPAITRHAFHRGPSQVRRLKARKSRMRARRRAR